MSQTIDEIFTYHPPSGTQPQRYVALREEARQMAELIVRLCPDSRERSLAITNLQQAIMWANASIAINENPAPERVKVAEATEDHPAIYSVDGRLVAGKS